MMLHAICFCGLLRDVKCHFCFFVSFVLNLQSFKSCELEIIFHFSVTYRGLQTQRTLAFFFSNMTKCFYHILCGNHYFEKQTRLGRDSYKIFSSSL